MDPVMQFILILIVLSAKSNAQSDQKAIFLQSRADLNLPTTSNEIVEFEKIALSSKNSIHPEYYGQQCQIVPIVHLIHRQGCQPKAISSFSCYGSCPSYSRVSIIGKKQQHLIKDLSFNLIIGFPV